LSFENDKDVERRRKSETASVSRASKENGIKKKKDPATAEVGNALRNIYQRTVNEDIPPDLLDLLGKLG
jgi:hypothetical protein